MRKTMLTLLAAATVIPALAATPVMAQSAREVRESARDVRRDERDLREARRYGDRRDVRDARRDVRDSRQELREDWRDYRRSNRQAFRAPAYRGPAGYRYRPVAVGHRFAPAYYGRNYWVNDYSRYRLPRPGPNARYVRYGQDVLLVNVRSGRVMRVYNNFFW